MGLQGPPGLSEAMQHPCVLSLSVKTLSLALVRGEGRPPAHPEPPKWNVSLPRAAGSPSLRKKIFGARNKNLPELAYMRIYYSVSYDDIREASTVCLMHSCVI